MMGLKTEFLGIIEYLNKAEVCSMKEKNQESNWEHFKAALKKKWHDLTDEELDETDGDRDRIATILEDRYGLNRAEAEKHFDELKF